MRLTGHSSRTREVPLPSGVVIRFPSTPSHALRVGLIPVLGPTPPMNSLEFFESLEPELAPFTDAEVDEISASTESNWRYRLELGLVMLLCGLLPVLSALLGLAAVQAYSLSGFSLLLAGSSMLACIYAAVRLAKLVAKPLVSARYRASFLRQLAAHRHARGL